MCFRVTHWLWRTTDDTIHVVSDTARIERLSLPAERSPEAPIARLDSEFGLGAQYRPATVGRRAHRAPPACAVADCVGRRCLLPLSAVILLGEHICTSMEDSRVVILWPSSEIGWKRK